MSYDFNDNIKDIMESSVKAGEENGGVFILYKDGKKIL